MRNPWIILAIIVLIYLPVAIDATVLHVAVPSLSAALSLTGNQLLWVMDIYSLVMAGLILPMGALGDRIGFKRLMIIGASIFGVASLFAAFADSFYSLLFARALLGLGAAMILPATLSGVRNTFLDEKPRNIALGIWATVAGGGAAFGPLIGGFILEHFHWGTVFLINIPIIIVVLILTLWLIPKQIGHRKQPLNLLQALILVTAILMLIYALKTGMHQLDAMVVAIFAVGASLLVLFVRQQMASKTPMIDFSLFRNRVISTSIVMAIVAMIALVGFELLLSQEMQFVYGYSPLQAGLFILPFMVAISIGGPLASIMMNKFGLRQVATAGMLLSAMSFWGLAMTDFGHQHWQAWALMLLMGISVEIALLSSTAAIMSSVPAHKASAAGAIESMAYELGAGFGIAIFGLMLSFFYAQAMILPSDLAPNLPQELARMASTSIGEAMQAAKQLEQDDAAQHLIQAASSAFTHSHGRVLGIAGVMFFILSIFVWWALPNKVETIDQVH